jgi:hypothetical protein
VGEGNGKGSNVSKKGDVKCGGNSNSDMTAMVAVAGMAKAMAAMETTTAAVVAIATAVVAMKKMRLK